MAVSTCLLYNIKEEKIKAIKMLLIRMRVKCKEVKKEDYLKPIGQLAGLKEFPDQGEYTEAGFEDEMLVMAGFSNAMVNELLQGLQKMGVGRINLKAVVTPHNLKWSSLQLRDELAQEHEQMKKWNADQEK